MCELAFCAQISAKMAPEAGPMRSMSNPMLTINSKMIYEVNKIIHDASAAVASEGGYIP